MKRSFLIIIPIFILLGFITTRPTAYGFEDVNDTTKLIPKPVYANELQLVGQLLDAYHFSKIKMNDSLSSVVLDEYVKSLDNNKTYFLASDIESFEKFRYRLDESTKEGDLSPAYLIYNVFKQRFVERMDYIDTVLLKASFDFTKKEYYETDRSELPYAETQEELNDIWHKVLKSQVLSAKLAGTEDKETRKNIEKRYNRFRKSLSQYNSEDVFQLYMNALAESYDPHTNYFSPRTADRFKMNMSLSLEGIGARLQTETDYTKVVQVLPGGPAYKSDLLHENDRIIGVAQGKKGEMENVIGWRIDDVVKLIKGPKGTTVRLKILPAETGVNGAPEEITLVREKIKLEDQEAKGEIMPIMKDGKEYKLGVITIPSFYMDFEAYRKGDPNYNSTTRDVKRILQDLKGKGAEGVLVDLRNNGGGSLAEAIDLTGLFIKDGPVVQVKGANPAEPAEVSNDNNPSLDYDGPLTVLINRFSASASEIFAGAIQDYKRGVVVGEQTYGKGTVQSVVDLAKFIQNKKVEVGQLKLTLQKFYRITGSSTQHLGVSPDINFPSAFDAKEFGESSKPSALPWDQIQSTNFELINKVSPRTISQLNENYKNRLTKDEDLIALVADTKQLKKSLENTRISLNEEERKKEMEEADKAKPAKKPKSTVVAAEGEGKSESKEIDDPYLKEGVLILTDLVVANIG